MEESTFAQRDKIRKGGVGLEGIGIFNLAGDGKTFVYCNADKRCIEVGESDKPEHMVKQISVLLTKDRAFYL